jgi:hypothetical protein
MKVFERPVEDYAELPPEFELTVVIRNGKGEPIGTKSITTDSPAKLAAFWHNNRSRPQRKKNRNKTPKSNLPKGKEAQKILEAVNKYADEVQEKKRKPPKEE